MFQSIRKRLTYANVAATLALFFAISGGALAASHYLITSTKQISPKVLKSLKGASGKPGANGANGTNGAAGPAGGKGETGAAGPNGNTGANGQSVTSKEIKVNETACSKLGGVEYTSASGNNDVCNGKEGSPWTAGGFLPSKKSESGVWAASGAVAAGFSVHHLVAAVSFGIPLKEPLSNEGCPSTEPCQVHVIPPGTLAANDPTGCTGTLSEPGADAGNLCIFTKEAINVLESPALEIVPVNMEAPGPGAGKSGALLEIFGETEGYARAEGIWVVTAK